MIDLDVNNSAKLSAVMEMSPEGARKRDAAGRCSPLLFGDKYRYFILVLTTLCLTAVFSNMLSLNFTIICMDPASGIDGHEPLAANASKPRHHYSHPTHAYSPYEKTFLQWTVAIAAAIATFPFSWLCCVYDARWVFFTAGIASALATAVIPLAAAAGIGWFVATRAVQGLAYACDFAVIGVICARWASLRESAKFIAVLTCFTPLASTLTYAVSGVICDSSLGWPWVHYLHAGVSLLLFVAWAVFFRRDPALSGMVSERELAVIHAGKSDAHKDPNGGAKSVPYGAICSNRVVLAVWLNAFADLFSAFFLIIYGPTFIKQVLKYSATETGMAGSVVTLVNIPVKLACGWISDSFHCIRERQKMWLFNSIAVMIPAVVYAYLPHAPAEHPLVTVIAFGVIEAIIGFNCGGFYKCGALVARQYADFVIAQTQLVKCVVFFFAPALVAIFVSDESNASQWHAIFYIIAGALIFANAIFCVYATDQPAEFTKVSKEKESEMAIAIG